MYMYMYMYMYIYIYIIYRIHKQIEQKIAITRYLKYSRDIWI